MDTRDKGKYIDVLITAEAGKKKKREHKIIGQNFWKGDL